MGVRNDETAVSERGLIFVEAVLEAMALYKGKEGRECGERGFEDRIFLKTTFKGRKREGNEQR